MPHEAISIFDMLKIGVGPSSSHTLGPWKAALKFIKKIEEKYTLKSVNKIQILLYGSLAKTGKGHGTDLAVKMGLLGENPETTEVALIDAKMQKIEQEQCLLLNGKKHISFQPKQDIIFLFEESLPFHPNGITFLCTFDNGIQIADTWYSIGGGFVLQEGEIAQPSIQLKKALPYPINTAKDLLLWCEKTQLPIHAVVLANELAWQSKKDIYNGVLKIWQTMKECIYRGVHTNGELPGGLHVHRRAYELNQKLLPNAHYQNFDEWIVAIKKEATCFQNTLDWISCFALAVNEENAAFGRVITAPTNGSAGVIPAVLLYYIIFCNGNDSEKIIRFLFTASEVGSIFKKGATISAAMGGCQAEIGVSSAMAAAALAEAMGGTPQQSLMAAEIAMEHHLGLTCDPIAGLVQVPCIERNAIGAIKAIMASQLALNSNPAFAKVPLDNVVKTMWETALDMNSKYKETSDGGLAINVPLGLKEC